MSGEGYVPSLAAELGEECARAFSLGYGFVNDWIREDLGGLSVQPRGTHIGQLGTSFLESYLPERWAVRYDCDFLFRFRTVVHDLLTRLRCPGWDGMPDLVRRVVDHLALYVILNSGAVTAEDRVTERDLAGWVYALNGGDDQVIAALFSEDIDPGPDSLWHFDHWFDLVHGGR